MKKSLKVLALLLALVMMLCACGGSKVEEQQKAEQKTETPADPNQSTAAPAAAPEGADNTKSARDTINLTLNQVVETLNPYKSSAIIDTQFYTNVYEPLFFLEGSEFEPRIGKSYEAKPDGMTYVVEINTDAKFHNGKNVTAEDVAWSFNFALRDGEYTALRKSISTFESATVIDDTHVEIKASETDAAFFKRINSTPAMAIFCKDEFLKAEADGKLGVEWVPMGTGPYVVTKYNPDSEIQLTAFPDYYRGEARIKNVNISILADNNTITVGFEAGDIDYIVVPSAAWESMKANSNYNTYLSPTNHTSYFMINGWTDNKPLQDKRVRKALAYATNREAMCIAAYDGIATPANSYFNPVNTFGGFTPEELKANNIEAYEYNPDYAKELLAEAGYADGCDIGEITCINGSYWEKMSTVFQSNVKDIGVTVGISLADSATCRQARKDGTYDMCTTGCNMTPDASYSYSQYRYYSDEEIKGGAYTELHYQDKALDDAFVKAMNEIDSSKLTEDWLEVNRIIQDNCYSLPTFHKAIPYAYQKDLVCEEINTNYYYVYNFYWAK